MLIKGHERGSFEENFSPDQVVKSASYFVYTMPIDRGEVAPEDWAKFTDIVDKGNQFRIHGSYFGQCTAAFGIQLFGYLHRKQHWHSWTGIEDESLAQEEDALLKQHEKQGDIANLRHFFWPRTCAFKQSKNCKGWFGWYLIRKTTWKCNIPVN